MLSLDAFSRAQMLLAARLCPDPLGEHERSPRLLSRNPAKDPTSKGGKEGRGGE